MGELIIFQKDQLLHPLHIPFSKKLNSNLNFLDLLLTFLYENVDYILILIRLKNVI